ncbi:peptide/nickel transport system substrate-binding protein [Azorhizobium sp. AG788]|uniref:ABC transporter substrate-binding protein n=3 Tax=Xanthobacteraceae TaxID=335928 RepID=UPI00105B4AC1|nr:ABC transporter substrate-binding protein [Azorhizobium sp. AG788]TDT99188.1 peptide/nickel transport system substrate-binding protein [Azorhizobium sp. AG788]
MRRHFSTLLATVMVGLCLGAAADAKTFRWARGQDAPTLDPHTENSNQVFGLLHQFYEPLVQRDETGQLVPCLALSWELKPSDPTVWVFKLRPNVTFHNGDKFTADDAVFSLKRAMDPLAGLRTTLAGVTDVTKVDDLTIEVKTAAPMPLLVNQITNVFMMDKKWAEANNVARPQDFKNKEETFAVRNENGTGPYIVTSREPDSRTVMKLNDAYWGKGQFPLQATDVVYSVIASGPTRVAALLSGEVDFVQDMPVQDIDRVAQTPGLKVNTGAEVRSIFFGLNGGSPELPSSDVKGKNPLADKRVRQAIEIAINREAIQKVVMGGQSAPSGTLIPPGVNGYSKALDAYPKWDIAKAKALMAEAGYPNGFTVKMNCPNNRYINDEKICQATVGFLGQIGIKATLDARPMAQHTPTILKDETDFYMLGWGVASFDAAYTLDSIYHSRDKVYGAYNATRVVNPELDKKIEALATEVDTAKRNALLAEVLAQVKDEAYFIPIHNQLLAWGMKKNIDVKVQPENQLFVKYVKID